ncbi:reverse transcriptase domain-containing protein [Tanacetum coccineum]
MEKAVLTLIHKLRSLRTIFQTYKVSGVTDGPMENMQSISVLQVLDKNNEGTFRSREKTHGGLASMTRAWRLYVRKEFNKEGSSVGMNLVDPEGGSTLTSDRRNMKDLHVSMDSKVLVDQVEGSRIPRTKEAKRYMEEIMDATDPFHRFPITYLPKSLNPKAEALTGLASIRLELLNQEVSVGIKTRTLVEVQAKLLEKAGNVSKKAASRKPTPLGKTIIGATKYNCIHKGYLNIM